jgi:hypothetical protein
MSTPTLIEELYTDKECKTIKELFLEDTRNRLSLKEAIGNKIIIEKDKILTSNALDIICLLCLTAKFAVSEDECHRIAITVYQFFDKPNNQIPSLITDEGLIFASKTLTALSFRVKAMEKRWKYHGAPSPSFYRKVSKTIFQSNGQKDIAAHHEQWEGFLGEIFI